MKTNTYFNKIKEIRDKATSAASTIGAAIPTPSRPSTIISAISKNKGDSQYKALKSANSIPKSAPDYNPDGSVTDYFKTRSVAEGVKNKMMKKK